MDKVIISIDPGLKGGISVLDGDKVPTVYKMPVKPVIVNKKKKNTYDMVEIVKIFSSHKDKKVLFFIEKQMGLGRESAVSTMTIGKNYGLLLGVAYALDFEIEEISSQKWKKHFPGLITDGMKSIKLEMKDLRVFGKTLKDKAAEKLNKKKIDKLGRNFKYLAKAEARYLASIKYPEISDRFKLVSSDGLAESLLIALYGRDKQNELVQNS